MARSPPPPIDGQRLADGPSTLFQQNPREVIHCRTASCCTRGHCINHVGEERRRSDVAAAEKQTRFPRKTSLTAVYYYTLLFVVGFVSYRLV